MAYLFSKLQKKYHLTLAIVHMNHRIRGRESDLDERSVRQLAERLNMSCFVESVNVPALAKKSSESLETRARFERYRFFAETAQRERYECVATAHHSDDQTETILMRILRGTGLRGLSAMAASQILYGIRVVRPLLGVSQKDIRSYLKKEKIFYREDRSNQDPAYFRNRIRRELLPLLRKHYSPQIGTFLQGLAQDAREYVDYLDRKAADFEKSFVRFKRNSVEVNRRAWLLEEAPLQKQLVLYALEKALGGKKVKRLHVARLHQLALQGASKPLALPLGWVFRVEGDIFSLRKTH